MKYTPQQPVINNDEIVLATFWQRAVAIAIDFICIIILYKILVWILPVVEFQIFKFDMNEAGGLDFKSEGFKISIWAFLPAVYFTFLTYLTKGYTAGKWVMQIKILPIYQHRISFLSCLERSLGYAMSLLELGLGFFQIFWSTNRMCLHDQIVQTIAIQEKRLKKIV